MSQDQQDEPVQFPTETTAIGSPHVTYVDKTPVDFPAVVIYRNSKGRPVGVTVDGTALRQVTQVDIHHETSPVTTVTITMMVSTIDYGEASDR